MNARIARQRGCIGRGVAVVVVALFLILCASAVNIAVHQRWGLLLAAAPDVALWGWLAFSLWGRPTSAPTTNADGGRPKNLVTVVRLLPRAFFRPSQQTRSGDALLGLRAAAIAFSVLLVEIASVLGRFGWLPNGPVFPWVPLLVVFATPSLAVDSLTSTKALDCSSAAALANAYRRLFMLRLAFAGAIAFVAYSFTVIGGPAWIYYPAAVVTLIRIWTGVVPTRARDQKRLNAKGCDLLLTEVL